MSFADIFSAVVVILAMAIVLLCAFAGMSRINDAMDDNIGSETGAERDGGMR